MGRRYDHSREELRRLMLDAARALVVEKGPRGLTARAVAERIGYAVGTLYTQFESIDDLVFHLNGETLADLDAQLAINDNADPGDQLRAMAAAYLAFAQENKALWQLLFDYSPTAGRELPGWYVGGIGKLISRVTAVVTQLRPEADRRTAENLAFGLFSSVHGICMMLVGRDYRAFAEYEPPRIVEGVVDAFVQGLTAQAPRLPRS